MNALLKQTFDMLPDDIVWRQSLLRASLVRELFRHHHVEEFCINWYDDGPEVCTWQDPYGPGIWHATQEEADSYARLMMHYCRRLSVPQKATRFYLGSRADGTIWYYWYGRDTKERCDYAWIMREN